MSAADVLQAEEKTPGHIASLKQAQSTLRDKWVQAVKKARSDMQAFENYLVDHKKERIKALETAQAFAFVSAALGSQSDIGRDERRALLEDMRGFASEQFAVADKKSKLQGFEIFQTQIPHYEELWMKSTASMAVCEIALQALDNE